MSHLEKRIKELFPLEDITVLNYTIMKEPSTVKCNTCGTEYTLTKAENFVRKGKTCICNKCNNDRSGKRLTLEDFQKKINEKYPNENLTVLNYTIRKAPCKIKCNICNEIYSLTHAESFLMPEKNRVCSKCLPNKRDQMAKSIENFNNWIKTQTKFTFNNLPMIIRSDTLVEAICNDCGAITRKTIYDYMRGRGCTYCSHNYLKTKEEYQAEIGEEYEVLEYGGMNHRSKFKHNICGFIYESSTVGYNCPRCKGSKGEKRIRFWLLNHQIPFEEQKSFIINGHTLRVDFYLPEKNLVIEYQGEQHFEMSNFFGGKEGFERQKLYDQYKRDYFKDKMIEIDYLHYDLIESILNDLNLGSSSTILNGVENQTDLNLEADTMTNK